jgi:PHD/YefM family antitoxin component YafN of YafNO toxin-antitoxin module
MPEVFFFISTTGILRQRTIFRATLGRARCMLNIEKDIRSVTDFKRATSALLKQLHKTKRPIVLTVNGRAELILQEASAYQQLLDRLEELEVWKAESEKHKNAAGAR